jgi:hypothetical protein
MLQLPLLPSLLMPVPPSITAAVTDIAASTDLLMLL